MITFKYRVAKQYIEKGLGTVTVNGEKITDFGSSGDSENHVEIECGVGAFNLRFSEN